MSVISHTVCAHLSPLTTIMWSFFILGMLCIVSANETGSRRHLTENLKKALTSLTIDAFTKLVLRRQWMIHNYYVTCLLTNMKFKNYYQTIIHSHACLSEHQLLSKGDLIYKLFSHHCLYSRLKGMKTVLMWLKKIHYSKSKLFANNNNNN